MIVKNEAPVIRRCLDSVRPLIDYWVIVDTGSSDGTQAVIREHLRDLPGELHERPWRDFAHNRSEALALARPHGDYSLIIDADDHLEIPAGFVLPALDADAYSLDIHFGGTRYQRVQLVRNTLPWCYRGVLHEFLDCKGARPAGHLGLIMHCNHDGARRRDPQTYRRDAAVLDAALRQESDPFLRARYTFYLAQSYRDCGAAAEAQACYLRRAELGYWDQEVYISLYQAGKLAVTLGQPLDAVLAWCLRASDLVPSRAEALHWASLQCRLAGRNQAGYQLAQRGLALAVPGDGLFVEPWIYQYGLLDEYAVNAYWAGQYQDSLGACLKILAHPACPEDQRARIAANAEFALQRLSAPVSPVARGWRAAADAGALAAAPRQLHSVLPRTPRVLIAILAKQKEPMLPLYLRCIEALDYPKSAIVLYIRTNNNTDRTREILSEWVERVRGQYAEIVMDDRDVVERVERYGVHEWNAERFRVLAAIRQHSLDQALAQGCDYYFTADVDNFVRPGTLRELLALGLPIVAPLLRSVDGGSRYSNYHADIDANGYFQDCPQYEWILGQQLSGVLEVPVVHCTYLIRSDVIPMLRYDDGSDRYEYVVFADSARRAGIPQYFDNRQVYGYLTLESDAAAAARAEALLRERAAPAGDPLAAVQQRFAAIYRNNEWGYGSGVGSLPENTRGYITFVQDFLASLQIASVVDFGCGDWQFSRLIDWQGARYLGLDVVSEVIEANLRTHARPGVDFAVYQTPAQIPECDLLLCKDVLQHLPNALVREYLALFKQRARYLLITNDDQPPESVNAEIEAGGWRPLRLDLAPFHEASVVVYEWTVQSGGWVPTHKACCLIEGRQTLLPNVSA